MMITKKQLNQVLRGVLAAAPSIPYIMKRRRTSVATYVLGGVGIAIAGGLTALMLLSPRTRTRALHAAKDTYEKVNDKVMHLRDKHGAESPMANGLVDHDSYATSSSSSGL